MPVLTGLGVIRISGSSDQSQRRLLLIDSAARRVCKNSDETSFEHERNIQKILSFIIHPGHSKMFYVLSQIQFSSIWDLSNHFHLGYIREIQRNIGDYERYGFVGELNKGHKHYTIIKDFWAVEHPTAPKSRQATLYMIQDGAKELIDEFSPIIFKKYVWKTDYSRIAKRKERYEKFLAAHRNRLSGIKKAEKNKLGDCKSCGKIIHAGSRSGKEYHSFPIGLICDTCKRNKMVDEFKKWMCSNK